MSARPMHHHQIDHGSPLGFTGERVLPDDPDWAWCFQAHKFGYDDLARRLHPGARILDLGCGEGYGADLLSAAGAHVTASDVSQEAVAHAAARYGAGAVRWLVSDAQRLPFRDRSFDVVCSLQVIEHFRDTESHLADVARVLRPDGWHYVTTPNIDLMGEAERDNPFHLRDFDAPMLRESLRAHFEQVELRGMFYVESSPRVGAMQEAERAEERARPRLERVERVLAPLPGPARVRLRPLLRRIAGVPEWPLPAAERARNAVLAEDFEAREPAEESFCLIGIARGPRVRS